jgi:hypothetical protein
MDIYCDWKKDILFLPMEAGEEEVSLQEIYSTVLTM